MGLFSGSHREGAEKCAPVGYYAASSGNLLPTFRDNLSVPSSGIRNYFLPTFRDNKGAVLRTQELFLTDISG